jgi:hypothetical protein
VFEVLDETDQGRVGMKTPDTSSFNIDTQVLKQIRRACRRGSVNHAQVFHSLKHNLVLACTVQGPAVLSNEQRDSKYKV